MENATKALVIAGAVLITILLIGYMIKTLDSTRGTVDVVEEKLSASEVNMFNSRFNKYVGTEKKYADALSLLNEILVNNANSDYKIGCILYIDDKYKHRYYNKYDATYTNEEIETLSKFPQNTYTISIGKHNEKNGRITEIRIIKTNETLENINLLDWPEVNN